MTTQQSTVERYPELYREYRALLRIQPAQRTTEQAARMPAVCAELAQILSVPPAGYALPASAANLVAHATAHGWRALVQWTPPTYQDEPYVTVQVGRSVTESEQYRGDHWKYELTWHSRGCAPGAVRRSGRILAETPDHPAPHHAPSVRAIRAVITAHPAPVATS